MMDATWEDIGRTALLKTVFGIGDFEHGLAAIGERWNLITYFLVRSYSGINKVFDERRRVSMESKAKTRPESVF